MPDLVEIITQIIAPIKAEIKSSWEIISIFTIPFPMVLATSVEKKAPKILKKAANINACLKERALVEIVVAMELAASLAPFQKS